MDTPPQKASPALLIYPNAPLQERRAGGMGIHLVKNMFDRIDYVSDHCVNRLELTLNFTAE